uniref:Uncharacterized protein n=1 Tax=Anguilla anguilla TaxID=7936 RepID=A0A0E9XAH7_ANGAN
MLLKVQVGVGNSRKKGALWVDN